MLAQGNNHLSFTFSCFTLCIMETCKMGTLANSEDPEKCQVHVKRNFVRVCTICQDKNDLQRKKYNYIWKIYPVTHRYIQWTIPSPLYQTRRNTPLVHEILIYIGISESSNYQSPECMHVPTTGSRLYS